MILISLWNNLLIFPSIVYIYMLIKIAPKSFVNNKHAKTVSTSSSYTLIRLFSNDKKIF